MATAGAQGCSIDPKARVWTVTLGPNGKLRAELDAKRVAILKLAA